MNKFNLTTIAAAIILAFSANAIAASDAAKDEAQAAAPAAKKESVGAYVDDAVITGKLKALILEESSLKSTEINVETYKGIVQLTGFVGSRANINKAVKIARSVKGVKSVKNDMVVKGTQ